jgi:ferric-dicitrate binding protein FerR (iron transport regulator)
MTELNQNIDFEIIWKKIHDQASEEEEIRLNEWLDRHSSHRNYYNDAVRYSTDGTRFANSPAELKKALKNIYRKAGIHNPYRNTRIVAFTSIAASIFLLVYFQFFAVNPTQPGSNPAQQAQSIVHGSPKATLILSDGTEHNLISEGNTLFDADGTRIKNTGNKLEYTGFNGQVGELKFNVLKVPRGGEYFLILADSTKVWLNSETTLRFPVRFAGNTRSVELNGEAYFEVARNEKVPFLVSSGNQTIKVLGTQFNISSYPENQLIMTTLVEGSVEVSPGSNQEEKLLLNPGEQSLLSKNTNKIEKRIVDVTPYIAWKDGRFVFQDQMLEDIMNTLSKWYDVQVVFANEEDKKLRFTGNLERYVDFSDILGKIERTNEIEFAIANNTIIIQ